MYTINESLGQEDITRIVSENIKYDQRYPCVTPSQKYEVDEEDSAKNSEKKEY